MAECQPVPSRRQRGCSDWRAVWSGGAVRLHMHRWMGAQWMGCIQLNVCLSVRRWRVVSAGPIRGRRLEAPGALAQAVQKEPFNMPACRPYVPWARRAALDSTSFSLTSYSFTHHAPRTCPSVCSVPKPPLHQSRLRTPTHTHTRLGRRSRFMHSCPHT